MLQVGITRIDRSKHTWEVNVKLNLQEIRLAEDLAGWLAF